MRMTYLAGSGFWQITYVWMLPSTSFTHPFSSLGTMAWSSWWETSSWRPVRPRSPGTTDYPDPTVSSHQGPPPPSSTAPVALQGGTAKGLDGAHWEAPTHSKRSSVPKARTVTHDCGDPGLVRHTDIPQIPTSRSQVPLTRFRDLPAFHQDTDSGSSSYNSVHDHCTILDKMEMGEDRMLTAAEAQSLEDTITVPKTYREAASDEHWVKSMNRELFALERNGTFGPLQQLPKGKRALKVGYT